MESRWYALKVFYNKITPIREAMKSDSAENGIADFDTFVPVCVVEEPGEEGLRYVEKQLVNSLLFVHCPREWLMRFKQDHASSFLWYGLPGDSRYPAPIDDREMRSFVILTSGGRPVEYLGSTITDLKRGQKVRVTGGLYEGAEGYIKRVRRNRRFLVAITGVAVVAVSYIRPEFLEAIE
ncbi:MAG: hypothetical protein IJT26_07810 [Bacteroidales bacterium]|nr:hypothetical protein [Bacteroidales bacterium]